MSVRLLLLRNCLGCRFLAVKCVFLLMWEKVVLALVCSWLMVCFSTCRAWSSGKMAITCWLNWACSSYLNALAFFPGVVV